eukprot:CAMPEP_0185036204 /NCGR_PEP_ID=MMETSP1103-20130426/28813_1 /TAXON_ID=36769 /ORGANISM="Paraphysomonas bandaiensis, Strain Caron Lab Isolate" /LENGTH=913 /DNA_ID=CAMNT_0027573657 /DNA_START=100 /DNA_END=2838 /DNA_ORIENTATION=-
MPVKRDHKPSWHSQWILGFILVLFSVSFITLGHFAQRRIADSNKCDMTYSRPHIQQMSVNTSVSEYRLHIHGSISDLAPTPVLFIPGNSGSPMQVRSFASSMHNDGSLQYFSLDFGNSRSATHASTILLQAVFLNDALREIASIYSFSPGEGQVIIVAHSAGGMVARAAIALDNHPRCIVQSILMLGTPNSRPTYTPDASLAKLYSSVNALWRKSMYPTSAQCMAAAAAEQDDDVFVKQHGAVSADWSCVSCIERVRIISITGGEVDMQVPSTLTHLHSISPLPHNNSAKLPTPVKIGSLLKPKGGWVRYIFTSVYRLIVPPPPTESAPASETHEPNREAVHRPTDDSTQPFQESNETSKEGEVPSPDSRTPFQRITLESWNQHMTPYTEPQHISVRTSQLQGVGFPVDHQALLWCKQLLKVSTKYIKRLATLSPEEHVNMSSIVKLRPEYRSNVDVSGVIPPLAEFLHRNASLHTFHTQAVTAERNMFHTQLGGETLSLFALVYNTSYLTSVLTCYVLIPLLIMVSAVLFDVADKSEWTRGSKPTGMFEMLAPPNHICLGALDDIFMALVPTAYLFFKANLLYVLIPAVAVCVGFMTMDYSNHAFFLQRYGTVLQWVISYGAALGLHVAFVVLLKLLRCSMGLLLRAGYTILRYTVWCNLIRKPITSAIKPMKKSAKAVMDLFTAEAVTTILLVSVITVGVYFSKKRSEENYASNILIVSAVVYLALWAFFLVVFILGLVWKHKKESILFPCTMALYLPGLILMKPSAQYCARIVSGDVTTVKTVSQLFELFGPDLINYCVAVFLMAYHLQYLQRNELVVKPIAFIVEFFDMSKRAQKKYNFGQNSMDFSTLIALSSNNQCLHEDGGEMAIFERNTKGVSSLSNGAVLYGPAYKVVSCNCSVNTKLKSFAEW